MVVHRFIIEGEPVATITADTGISRSTLYAWIKAAQNEPAELNFTLKNFRILETKIKRILETKIKRFEEIVKILQRINCTVNAPLNEKLSALEELYSQYYDALQVLRGTFYNHIFRNKRDNTWYVKRREELRIRIQQILLKSGQSSFFCNL